ncbi:MAG: endolytic transglycosylase MltG [Candidatus Paceibacterota bacterium]
MVAVIFVVAIALIYWPGPHDAEEAVEFNIPKGQSLGSTARLLAEEDLIHSRLVFVAYALLAGQEKKFKAGDYLIPPSASTRDLVFIFSRGLSQSDDIVVTIPEGTNLADAGAILERAGVIKEGDLLGPSILDKEGFLFPDTYRFKKELKERGGDVAEVVRTMENNFNLKTQELFVGFGRDKIERTLIVASILEKEVRKEEDMRLVAGIIEKRLSVGMALQLDATVAYGVCYPKFLLGQYCNVSLANIVDNLRANSVYNTYSRTGLPAGPISSPGLQAIKAALNPQSSDFLFYLNARDGTTVFSRTGVEHEEARRKYILQ